MARGRHRVDRAPASSRPFDFLFLPTVPRSSVIGLAVALLLAGGALLWGATSRTGEAPPPRQPVPGLTDTASIGWTAQETALIEASNAADALSALGYAHGMTRPWVVTVWRRTALGTLSQLFGTGLVPLDRHARQLGLTRHARQAYERLPAVDRRHLQAYTRGLNAALQSGSVRRRAPFLFFNLMPRRWAPWHPLAIERLLAWMGTDPSASRDLDSGSSPFWAADRRLRRWLHLHGWDRSVAWAAHPSTDTTRTALFARHVLGTSADPLLQEVRIRRPDASPTVVASMPGTLLFPTGTTGTRAWTRLLESPTRLDRVMIDSARLRDWHERIDPKGGAERLVHVQRQDSALVLPDSAGDDSVRVLQWTGLRARSDTPHWTSVANLRRPGRAPPPLHLFREDGLTIDSTGRWTVRGRPPVVDRGPNSVLVGESRWAQYQADALQAHQNAGAFSPRRWSISDSSTWAARRVSRLLPDLAPLSGTGPLLDEALTYLRNWDFTYGPSSIGAVLFERWMDAYRSATGQRPLASTYFAPVRRRRAFRRAVENLAAQYGRDVRRWRWERVAPDRRNFLVWSADSLVSTDLQPLSTTRFAPLHRPGRGHASALAGGLTLLDPPALGPAPTHWSGWTWSGQADLTVRRLRFDPSGFFARPLLRDERPAPISVVGAHVPSTTRLVPAPP